LSRPIVQSELYCSHDNFKSICLLSHMMKLQWLFFAFHT